MEKGFWNLIYSSFREIGGYVITIIGIPLALLLWCVSPNKNISLGWVLPIGLVCLILIVTLCNAIYKSLRMSKLPKVLYGGKSSIQGTKCSCLLEPSELFSYNVLVSFYYIDDDGFERLIGLGAVLHIQEDNKIQVIMNQVFKGYEKQVEKIAQNNARILAKIKVKPSIPHNIYLNTNMRL